MSYRGLSIPTRPDGAPAGSAFVDTIKALRDVQRESRIAALLEAGNMPQFLRTMAPVRATVSDSGGATHQIEYHVMPDYLSVGGDADFVRTPMDPVTAQQIADRFGCLLPTARMVEQIAFALRQAETGTPVAEVIRKMGISEQMFYRWKKRYAGMGVAEVRRLKQLEEENRKLKQLVADLSLDKVMLQDVIRSNVWSAPPLQGSLETMNGRQFA